ncbi:MAG: phosphoribulokinase, partial [Elainellaceae cyanobacterium]
RPQRQWADVVVTFYPPKNEPVNEVLLNARLVLRPTIPHPDFTHILSPNGSHLGEAIRLGLDRDMGKPVDVLEVDGHATDEQVKSLERVLCNEIPYLGQFCSLEGNQDLGKLTGTTGETLQSYPLALTQLIITYHMLKAADVMMVRA